MRRAIVVLPNDAEAVDAVVGYRAWVVRPRDGEMQLASVHRHCLWPQREVLRKSCQCGGPVCTDKCGIYAWVSEVPMLQHASLTPHGTNVYGEVYLWGDVHVHEFGYRAEWAMVAALYVSDRQTSRDRTRTELAALQYGVPVIRVDARLGNTAYQGIGPIGEVETPPIRVNFTHPDYWLAGRA